MSNAHTAHVLQATWQAIQHLERTLLAAELVAFSGGPQSLFAPAPVPVAHAPSLW